MNEIGKTATAAHEATLDKLPEGVHARISRLEVSGADRRRLMDLGFVPGAHVALELENPLGDPRAFRVMGGVVAIRREQARKIWAAFSKEDKE